MTAASIIGAIGGYLIATVILLLIIARRDRP